MFNETIKRMESIVPEKPQSLPPGYELTGEEPRAILYDQLGATSQGSIIRGATTMRLWPVKQIWTWPSWLGDGELFYDALRSVWTHVATDGSCIEVTTKHFPKFVPPPDKEHAYSSREYRHG